LLISVSVLAELPVKKHNSFSLSLILGPKAHDLLTYELNVTKYPKK
jgi:hypothetical protein